MKEKENLDEDIMDGMAKIFAEMDERVEHLSAEVDKIIAKMKRAIDASDKENFC